MPDVEGITHEAASLYRFIESIERFCTSQPGFAAYLEGSSKFLAFIEGLANSTKVYLEARPKNVPDNASDYRVYRQELRTLRFAWHYVHRLVKPVADAHTLHQPESLIDCLVRRLRSMPDFAASELAILHIRELNYLQVIAGDMRAKLTEIANLVGSSPPFPPNLGLIGIPYSQAKSVLINSLIAHEIGHFVFETRQLRDVLGPKIRAALDAAFKPFLSQLQMEDARRIPGVFTSWSEELFCDLFAVRFVGPCYCYAFIETFDLSSHLETDGTIHLRFAAPQLLFAPSHPAHFYRIQKQAEMLEKLGWWAHIENSQCATQKVLARCEALPTSCFSFPFNAVLQKGFIDALDLVVADIVATVEECVRGTDTGVKEYSRLSQHVRECFLEGVVPSMVKDPESGRPVDAVTVLNVAYQLYLDNLPDLMERILDQDAGSAKDRTQWTEKLEQWTLKALSDIALVSAKAGA